MKVTSKGQVTIPVAMRQRTGLLPATEVEFVLQGEAVVLRKARGVRRRGARLVQAMRGKGDDSHDHRSDHGPHAWRLKGRVRGAGKS